MRRERDFFERKFKLDITNRLLAVASFVRNGSYFIDVGTDHAYLPIYLIQNEKTERALASDINEGPCESAERHIAECGLSEKISVRKANGLCGISSSGMTDIAIAGMGGALIAEILAKADFIKDENVRLILQPMRNAPDLRRYLCENGFRIIGESLAREDERIYEIICAQYCGCAVPYTELSLLLGEKNMENKKEDPALFNAFCEKNAAALTKKINGMQEGGADASAEKALLSLVLNEKEV